VSDNVDRIALSKSYALRLSRDRNVSVAFDYVASHVISCIMVWGCTLDAEERKQRQCMYESSIRSYRARCFIRLLTVLSPAYTLPGGEPKIKETTASRAILIFWKEPMM
jgi:hypothetical protein